MLLDAALDMAYTIFFQSGRDAYIAEALGGSVAKTIRFEALRLDVDLESTFAYRHIRASHRTFRGDYLRRKNAAPKSFDSRAAYIRAAEASVGHAYM